MGQRLSRVRAAWQWADRHADWLLLGGLAAATLLHTWRWRQDRPRPVRLAGVGEDAPMLPETPLVSILLPAWNEATRIEACIGSILELHYPHVQLIVCAGGVDGTLELARRHAGEDVLVLEQQPGEGKQGALRRSFAHANGEIIFLTDADCLLEDAVFERTLAPLIAQGEDAVTGAWRPLDSQAAHPFVRYQWSHHVYRELYLPDYPPTLDGRNAAVRRDALEQVRAFAVEAPIGTDYVLSKLLTNSGYIIRFARGSRVQTAYPETFRAYWKQQSRWFRNPVLLGVQRGDWPQVIAVIRAGLAAMLLLAVPMIGGLGSKFLWAGWLSIVAHLWLSALRVMWVLELCEPIRPRIAHRMRLVLYLPVGWIAMARGMAQCMILKHRWIW